MNSPTSPEHLRQQAEHLMAAGRLAEAIVCYRRLLAQTPDDADSTYNLAWLWQQSHQPERALAGYETALQLGIAGSEEVHLNRAVLLADVLARPDEALQALRQAIALKPDYLPAWLNLGNVHEQLGEREAANEAYQTVLRLAPGHALALARLCGLGACSTDPTLLGQIRQALIQPRRTALERADLGFALGKALDAMGDYDAAFAAYQQANLAADELARGRRYEPEAQARWVGQLIERFSQPLPALPPHEGPQLVFICGMFRSGSSLTEQILASHPQVTPGGELDLLPRLAQSWLQREAPPSSSELAEVRTRYLHALTVAHPGAQVLTDKRVDNFLHLGLIRAMFPTARIVVTERGALDNGLALYFLHLGDGMPWARSLAHIGHWYGQYQRLMRHWRSLHGAALHTVSYDHLVQTPEAVIRPLLSHCGLPWDSRCLQPHQTRSQVKTPSAWQVRQPIYTGSLGRWRHYERHLAPLRAALEAAG